ncbi:MAG TPA: L,D-transpeptidase [Ramlibacter sp.]|nr:L,D-transpeptidase [Ramlibacter sp.]
MRIDISLAAQTLTLLRDGGRSLEYPVSTAARGAGCASGSYCTPVGRHRVRLKIGGGCPPWSVFVGRRPTGEILTEELRLAAPDCDWILSRLLWLQGMEPGVNRGGEVDTLRRLVYIHGTADEARIGQPASHGCIRMRNNDIVELFELVPAGTEVLIG